MSGARCPATREEAYADPFWRSAIALCLLAEMPRREVSTAYNADIDIIAAEGNGVRYVGPRGEWFEHYWRVQAKKGGGS